MMNKFLTKLLLTIIGAILFIAFIWYRFIRERLPKDIPLKLSFLGFCILVSICGIFLYIVVSLIRQSKSVDPLIKQIVDSIYIPLKTFDHYIKKLSYTNNTYKYGINFLAYILGPLIIDSTLFYYLFMIIPRLILLTTLYIDIFWFHKLYYIYKILLIGSVIFLGKYIIYSFKYAKEHFIEEFKHYVSITIAYEYAIQIIGPLPEEDDDYLPTLVVPLPPFIDFQTETFLMQNSYLDYMPYMRNPISPYYKEHNIIVTRKFTYEEVKERVSNILKISLILAHYDSTNNCDDSIKTLKILIYLDYLLCCSYILIVSLPSLYYASFWELWIIFNIQDIEEPFSGDLLIYWGSI